MPNAARTICRDCNQTALERSPYCAKHQTDNRASRYSRDRNQQRRDSGLKKLYDCAAWRKRTKPFVLSRDPLCTIGMLCRGTAFSTDVDHTIRAEVYIAQHGGDQSFFYDTDNLRGACHACHSHKTARENVGAWKEPSERVDPEGDMGSDL
jgi:5-methylcytosine-specific restriction enzyme A